MRVAGSCLCGAVSFEVQGRIHLMSYRHCSMCRKFSGSAFLTFARARTEQFRWLSGEECIRSYESSPGCLRSFCITCGSAVPVARSALPNVLIPAGVLDDDPMVKPSMHIFTASKAPWYTIVDTLPQWQEIPLHQDIEAIGRCEP